MIAICVTQSGTGVLFNKLYHYTIHIIVQFHNNKMRSLARYLDPTKPIRWMWGSKKETTVDKQCVIVLADHTDIGNFAPLWGSTMSFQLVDLADVTEAQAKQDSKFTEDWSDLTVVAHPSADVLQIIENKGITITHIIAVAGVRIPKIVETKKCTRARFGFDSTRENSVTLAIYQAMRTFDALSPSLEISICSGERESSEEGEVREMASRCPYAPFVKDLAKHPDTLEALQVIGENLLYKGCEDRYRTIFAGSDRFQVVLGKHNAAIEILSLFGFEAVYADLPKNEENSDSSTDEEKEQRIPLKYYHTEKEVDTFSIQGGVEVVSAALLEVGRVTSPLV